MEKQFLLLKEEEVAEILGVSKSWLQKGRVYGYGPSFIKLKNPKGGIRYLLEDVELQLARCRIQPESIA